MTQSIVLRIGTRGSPLALAQARMVRAQLAAAHGFGEDAVEIKVIRTSGDRIQDRPLSEAGGKGLFTKEIEEALLLGHVDLAVHSAKDMPTVLPDGLALAACLPREDVRDAFISHKAATLAALPQGAVIGTASLRRQAMVRRLRPDLRVVPLRGNVETRLKKLAAGEVDATLLALAGLKRLGLAAHATALLDAEAFLPAVGQGAITIEVRDDDAATREALATIDDADTSVALAAERAFLAVLDGSCRTPIAGHAVLQGNAIRFRGMILRPDGSEAFETTRAGDRRDAVALGADAGAELKGKAPPDFFRGPVMRLLVTRPEDDAARTAQALRARGHEALIAPLMRIEILPAEIGGSYDAIAMTSANAARAVIFLHLPVLTVGDRSAQAARDAGYATVESADGALADLVALVAKRFPKGRILYLAGEDRAGDLAGDLARQGIAVDTVAVYRAVAADALPAEVLQALHAGRLDAAVHYSRRSAATLLRLAEQAGVLNAALSLAHYCLSAEVAAPLGERGAGQVRIAASPHEAALIDLNRFGLTATLPPRRSRSISGLA